ncbi:MAG: Ig-like domain-containing protein [Steroidobacteraceae bacterium]
MRRLSIITAAAVVLLAACSGSKDFSGTGGASTGTSGTGTTGTGTTGTGTTTYEMGNGSGGEFQSGMIGISNASVAAGGSTSLSVTVVDQAGALYTAAALTVTFSSACISQGLATIAASGTSTAGSTANTVTSTTGAIDATYAAKGCSGADVITATTAIGSTNLTATGTVTVAAAAIGSIQFESATPTTIGLKGTGLNETATVVFKVVDSTGGARPGVTVNFSLSTTAGGIGISPASAVSGTDGTVQTVVSSGVEHSTVRVTATIASPALSTQSSQLTVSTGLPASNSFSLSLGPPTYPNGVGVVGTNGCSNVEAYTLKQTTVPVTATLSDRYGNPVPDGTSVAFQTDGGTVTPQCTTTGGACSVTWTSTNPVPSTTDSTPSAANGRAMILATAIGEESFTDLNGSGYYISPDPFMNLGEPFLDVNESSTYVSGDPYYNFYNASAWQGPASPPVFKGIVCTGDTVTSTCTSTPLGIGAQQLVIMSGTYAQITLYMYDPSNAPAQEPQSVPAGYVQVSSSTALTAGGAYGFTVTDANGNPMAALSTVTAAVSPAAVGTLSGTGTSFTTSCGCFGGPANPHTGAALNTPYCPLSSLPSNVVFLPLTFAAGAPGSSGSLNITVQTPGTKITTFQSFQITL